MLTSTASRPRPLRSLTLTLVLWALVAPSPAAAQPAPGSNYSINVIGSTIPDPVAVAGLATSVRRLGDLTGRRHFSWQLAAPDAVPTFPYANPSSEDYDWSRLDALACSAAIDLDGDGEIDPASEPNFQTFALLWPYNDNATFDVAPGCPGQGPSPILASHTCSYWNHPHVPAPQVCDPAGCGSICGPQPGRECHCGDEVDDDADGLLDCEDPDCAAAPVCDLEAAKGGTPFHCQPCDVWTDSYQHFLEALFERYDGDGVDDVPTGPGAPCPTGWLGIHDWELVNEPENFAGNEGVDFRWINASDTAAGALSYFKLAQHTRLSFDAVCTGCSLMNGGLAFPTDGVAGGHNWLPQYFQGPALTFPNDWWYHAVNLGAPSAFDGYSFHYVWFGDLFYQPNRANVNHYLEGIAGSGWTPTPMRLTELALPATWNGVTDYVDCNAPNSHHSLEVEEHQATAYVETATLASTEGVETVSFLGLELPQESSVPGSTYGLRHCDGTPKAAFFAAQQLASHILWEPASPPQVLQSQSCAVLPYDPSGASYCARTDPANHPNPPPQADRVAVAQVHFPATGAYVFWDKTDNASASSIPGPVLDPNNSYTLHTATGIAIDGLAQPAAASCLSVAGTPLAQAIACLDAEQAVVAYELSVAAPVFGLGTWSHTVLALGLLAAAGRVQRDRNRRRHGRSSEPTDGASA